MLLIASRRWLWKVEYDENSVLFYFDESERDDGASCLKNVALHLNETETAIE